MEGVNEVTLWDRALPGQVPLLREKFAEVREKRNGVMHAHNIDRKEFIQSKNLFSKINSEIDDAIANLAAGALIPNDYNEQFAKALEELNDVELTNGECKYFIIENGKLAVYRALDELSVKSKDRILTEMNQNDLFDCPNCGKRCLELQKDIYHCLSCGIDYSKDEVKFCTSCGTLYIRKEEDNGICECCNDWIDEKIRKE